METTGKKRKMALKWNVDAKIIMKSSLIVVIPKDHEFVDVKLSN